MLSKSNKEMLLSCIHIMRNLSSVQSIKGKTANNENMVESMHPEGYSVSPLLKFILIVR